MKKTSALFALIKSLSRNEKRYLTLEARKSGGSPSRYWTLYQLLNKQDEYDEAQLQKKLKGDLSDDKSRLYEAILRAMRHYRSRQSRSARIKDLLLDADFLYDRGLYDQSHERLMSAHQFAEELDDQLARLEVNKEIRRVANTLLAKRPEGELLELIAEKDTLIGLLHQELELLDLHDQIIRAVQAGKSSRLPADRDELRARYADPLFNRPPPASVQGALRYYQSRGLLGKLLAEPKMIYENYNRVVDIWLANPVYKQEEFRRYLDDASNRLTACFQYEPALSRAPELLRELESESPEGAHDRLVLFQRTASARLVYYINYDNRQPAAQVLAPIEQGLRQHQLNPVSEVTIRFNAAILLFLQEQPSDCERWLLSILDMPSGGQQRGLRRSTLRPDIGIASRLLRITTLYDQDAPVDYFDSQLRAERRHLQAHESEDRLAAFGRFWLGLLRRLRQLPTTEQAAPLQRAMEAMQNDWQRLPNGLDQLLLAWLHSRQNHRPLLDNLGI